MLPHLNLFQWIVVPCLSLLFLHSLILAARGTHRLSAGVRALLWFAAAAAVLRPEMTAVIAKSMGIGRGADLILYLFIIGFMGAALYFYGRIVKLETALTVLVRQFALQDKAQTKS